MYSTPGTSVEMHSRRGIGVSVRGVRRCWRGDEHECGRYSGVSKNYSRSRLGRGRRYRTKQAHAARDDGGGHGCDGSGLDVWCKSRIAIDRPARAVWCEPCANQKSLPTSLPLCTVKSTPDMHHAPVSVSCQQRPRKRGIGHSPSCRCPTRARVAALHFRRDSPRLESSSPQTAIAALGVAPWDARRDSAV